MTSHTEIPVSEARARLPELIAQLPDHPITLLHYGKPVADLVPHTSAADRAATDRARLQDAVDLVEACGDAEMVGIMSDLGMRSIDDVKTLLAKVTEWKEANGYDLNVRDLDWIAEELPDVYQGNIDAIAAYLHLDPDNAKSLHEAGADVTAWSDAIAHVRRAALQHDDHSHLLDGYHYEGEEPDGAFLASLGIAPAEFTRRALELIGQGVAAKDILSTFDDDALPDDVLAIGQWASMEVRALADAGISQADAVRLIRHYGKKSIYADLRKFAHAGARDVSTLIELIDSGANAKMASRAADDDLTAAEWSPLIGAVDKYAYAEKGELPFQTLAEAAAEGFSLTAWDKLPRAETATKWRQERYWSTTDEPFRQIYFGRIMDVGRVGITPGYALACWSGREWFLEEGADFVTEMLALRNRGLKLEVMKFLSATPPPSVLARDLGGRLPSPQDLREVLHRLIDMKATAAELEATGGSSSLRMWDEVLAEWRQGAPLLAEYLKEIHADEERSQSFALMTSVIRSADHWSRRAFITKLAQEALNHADKSPENLHQVHFFEMVAAASRVQGPREWGQKVLALRDDFVEYRKKSLAASQA